MFPSLKNVEGSVNFIIIKHPKNSYLILFCCTNIYIYIYTDRLTVRDHSCKFPKLKIEVQQKVYVVKHKVFYRP